MGGELSTGGLEREGDRLNGREMSRETGKLAGGEDGQTGRGMGLMGLQREGTSDGRVRGGRWRVRWQGEGKSKQAGVWIWNAARVTGRAGCQEDETDRTVG